MKTVTRRPWLVVALALVVGVSLLLVLLHSPPGRRSVLAYASGILDDRSGIQLQAQRLDYNLLTLDFELTGMSLAASEAETPFLAAARVHVDLPWSAVTGPVTLTVVEVDDATLSLVKSADGRWNLPASSEGEAGGTETPFALPPVGRLDLTDLGISVQAADYDVTATAVSLQLATASESSAALSGPLHVAQPIQIRWRDGRTTLDQLDAQIEFDGERLTFEPLEMELPEGQLFMEGRALSLFTEPTLDLTYRAEVVLGRAAEWWRPDHGIDGQAVASGTVTGPVAAPHVTTEIETSGLQWAELSELAVRATTRLEPDAFVIDNVTVTHGDGSLDASGQLALGDVPAPSRLDVTWQDFDTLALVCQLELELPYAPAGIVSGHGVVTWTKWSPEAIQLETEITSRMAGDQAGVVPFGGMARLEASDGRWVAELDNVTVPGLSVRGRVGGQLPPGELPLVDTTLEGDVIVVASDLTQVAHAFELPGLTSNPSTPGVSGGATIEIALDGTVASPSAEGRIADARVGYRGVDDIDLRGMFIAGQGAVSFTQLAAVFGPNQLTGNLRLDFEADTVDGLVDVRLPDVSALAPALPEAVAPTGSLDAHTTVSGTLGAPHIEADIEGHDMTVAGRALHQLATSVSLEQGVLGIETFEVRQQAGRVRLQGSYVLADGTYELHITGHELSLESLVAAAPEESSLSGQLQFDVTSSGSVSNPKGNGTARVDALEWAGRPLQVADVTFALGEGSLRADAEIPSLNATATGTIGLVGDDATFDVTADFFRTELDRLFGPATGDAPQPDVSGIASLRLTTSGDRTALARTRMTLELRELDGLVGPTRLRLAHPGSLGYAEGVVTTERLEVLLDDTRLTLDGSLNDAATGRLTATLAGDLSDLEPLAALVAAGGDAPAPVNLNGAVDTEIVVTGSFREPTVSTQVQVRDGSIVFGDFPPAQELDIDLSYDMQAVRLERFAGTWQGANLSGHGELPAALLVDLLPSWVIRATADRSVASLALTADQLTAEALAPFVDSASLGTLDSRATARLDIEADSFELKDIRARLTFDQIDLTLAGIPVTQSRPTEADLADGLLTVRSLAWGGLGNELTLGGTIDLRTAEPTVDMTLTGEGDLRLLGALVGGAATAGQVFAIVNFQGTTSEPVIRGTVEISDAELRLADPPLLVSELAGTVWLEGDRLRTYEMTGLANGGEIEIDGAFQLEGLRPAGAVTFTGREVAMDVPEGLRTAIDTAITLDTTGEELSVSGTVTVLRGDYRQTLALTTGLLATLEQRQEVTVIGQDEPSALDDLQLNVRVVSEDDIVVDNNYANGEIGLDLRLVGTVGSPALTGRASLREGGQIRLANNIYEIESGVVDFVDPSTILPELNVTAITRVASYEVTLTLTGTPEALTTTLQSDPPRSESDIVSLLLTGRTMDQAEAAAGAVARDQAIGLVSGELLGTAGRSVGLDTVRIESEVGGSVFSTDSTLVAGETNPGSRVTVGKNLSSEVQLIVSQNLREAGLLTWIIDYLPRRNIELRGVLDDDNNRSYEFRHSISFGNPPRESRQTPVRTRRVAPAVSAVQFSETLGFDESDLMNQIRLRSNDRFNFQQWLRDRDRLEQFYSDRGYFEARIRARRLDDAGQLTLEYEIQRGPRTILTVDGYALSGDTVDRMHDAWSAAVFDGFLLAELRDLARQALIEDTFAQASVESEVLERPEANEKEIRLRIEAGPRFSERHLTFSGNQHASDLQLAEYLDARGLTTSAWTNPESIVVALTSLYRSLGFLDAEIQLGVPEFDRDRATQPFLIQEHATYRVSDLQVGGVTAFDAADILRATGLVSNDLYTDSAVQQARAGVSARYRQEGFTLARVSIRSAVDRNDGTVAIAVDIDEGPRQVVQEVVIAGAERTRPELISRALQIEAGQPVDVAGWNLARKRLYDTGAFRSVDIEAQPIEPSSTSAVEATQAVRARVLLEEWPTFRVRYGLQLKDERTPLGETGRDFNLGVVGDLTHPNFLGRAATVGTAFRYDTIQQALRGFLTFRTFFGLPLTSNVFASRLSEDFGGDEFGFIDDTRRLTVEQRLKIGNDVTLAYSYNLSRAHNKLKVPDPRFTEPPVWIARLNASAIVDTRDDVFNATQGWFHSSTFEYAPKLLGSDLRFAKYSAQEYYYRNFGSRVVIASAARLGLAGGLGGEFLIRSERFFAGGSNTVRGYGRDALAPFIGGNSLLVLNQEIRFPLFSIFQGVGFLDAGNAFETIKDLSIRGLQVGSGVGLRAATAFGLLRFDIGFPVSDVEDQGPRFYFSIGQAF